MSEDLRAMDKEYFRTLYLGKAWAAVAKWRDNPEGRVLSAMSRLTDILHGTENRRAQYWLSIELSAAFGRNRRRGISDPLSTADPEKVRQIVCGHSIAPGVDRMIGRPASSFDQL